MQQQLLLMPLLDSGQRNDLLLWWLRSWPPPLSVPSTACHLRIRRGATCCCDALGKPPAALHCAGLIACALSVRPETNAACEPFGTGRRGRNLVSKMTFALSGPCWLSNPYREAAMISLTRQLLTSGSENTPSFKLLQPAPQHLTLEKSGMGKIAMLSCCAGKE